MRNLWAHRDELKKRILAQKKVALFVDFDGTLSPIVSSPGRARLHSDARSILRRLKRNPRIELVVSSGRSLSDLIPRVGVPSLLFAGNHGLEIAGPGVSFLHGEADRQKQAFSVLASECFKVFKDIPGALVENKELSLGLHYRRVHRKDMKHFWNGVRKLKASTEAQPLRWRAGKKVEEILPAINWDKGRATLLLLETLDFPFPIALGDDRTDEDMFRAIKGRGISIHVRSGIDSIADYSLGEQADVIRFLTLLADLLEHPTSVTLRNLN